MLFENSTSRDLVRESRAVNERDIINNQGNEMRLKTKQTEGPTYHKIKNTLHNDTAFMEEYLS